ncbi:MAG: TonB-dependent receptor [Bryobacteraceae bacterium]
MSIAEVSGLISDSTGAAVPGAAVKIVEIEKQAVRTVTSDAAGRYTFPNLPVGPYRLEVTAGGFKAHTQSGIVLQVGNSVTVNVSLEVGNVSERIEVQAQVNMVETKENTISQVIDKERISELPLNGRQPTQLILLSGAALTTPGGGMVGSKNYFSSTTISVAGGQANGINYLLDGGDHNDSMTNVNMPIPFPDALQEFSVQTSALPARYGLHPGAVVNAVTKSGTNQIHGDVFEFLRNGNLNARNTFASVHDSLKRNQFGGTLGGKIIRDKLFFFGGFQGTRQRSDPPQTISFVGTQAVLGGDFSVIDSGACISGGRGRTLTDPTTRSPFPGNVIPVSRFNPQAVGLLTKYIPLSQDPCGRITYGIKTTGDEEQMIGRVDWVQNAKHNFYGRYFLAQYKNPPVYDGKSALTTTAPGNWERAQTITLGDTYSFSATTLNSFHATGSRRRDNRGVAPNFFNPRDLGLNVFAPIPNFTQISLSNYWSIGCGTCAAGHFNTNSLHLADDVDIIRGKHQLAFGVDYLRDHFNFINGYIQNGSWAFNGQFTGDSLADYMLGLPNDFTQSNQLEFATRASVFALYAQDTIRVSKRLTMNVGIRFEPSFAAYDYFGRGTSFSQADFIAGKKSQVFTAAPAGLSFYGDQGIPKAYFNNRIPLFSPRMGLVWDPTGSGRQSLRVSAAILRDTAELFYSERLTTNAPYGSAIDIPSPTGGFSNPYSGYPGGNPFPQPAPPPKNFPFAPYSVFVNMPLQTHPTYTAQWNVSYQNEFRKDWLGSISYLGNKTTHVWVGEEINPAIYGPGASTGNTNQRRLLYRLNPTVGAGYASIVQSEQGANSRYAGVLMSVQHRMAHHFTLLFNYTYSHCISDGDFGGELAGNYYMDPSNRTRDRASCNFDVRHLANTSMIVSSPFQGGMKGKLLGGWQFAPIVSAASGIAINVTSGRDNSLTAVGLDRPNLINPNAYSTDPNPRQFLNPASFAQNDTGTFGNLGRSAVHGPGRLNFDLSLSRSFRFQERYRLEARFEAFNAINHTNYSNPTTNLSSANFGKILGAADPRILQVSMKFHF